MVCLALKKQYYFLGSTLTYSRFGVKGTLKLNIDGNFLEDSGCLGVGGVVRNRDEIG